MTTPLIITSWFKTDGDGAIKLAPPSYTPIQEVTPKNPFGKRNSASETDILGKALFAALKKIAKYKDSLSQFDAVKTSRTDTKVLQLFLRTTGANSQWVSIDLNTEKERKAAEQIEFLIHGVAQRIYSKDTWLEEFFPKKDPTKEGEFFSTLRKIAAPFPELVLMGTSIWGIFQPAISGLTGSFLDIGSGSFTLCYYKGENLPISPIVWIILKGILDGVRGKKTHVRSDLLDRLPDHGMTLDKQAKIDSTIAQVRSVIGAFVCLTSIVVTVSLILTSSVALTTTASVAAILGPALSIIAALLALGNTFYQTLRIARVMVKITPLPFRGTDEKNNKTLKWLVEQVQRTKEDENKVDLEQIKVPSRFLFSRAAILEKIHGWGKTPLERYQGKLEKQTAIKENQYLRVAGKKSLYALQGLEIGSGNKICFKNRKTVLSAQEIKKIITKVKIDCSLRSIEKALLIGLYSFLALANIVFLVSACTAQYATICLSVAFGLLACMCACGFGVAMLDIIELIRTRGLGKKDQLKDLKRDTSVPVTEKPAPA